MFKTNNENQTLRQSLEAQKTSMALKDEEIEHLQERLKKLCESQKSLEAGMYLKQNELEAKAKADAELSKRSEELVKGFLVLIECLFSKCFQHNRAEGMILSAEKIVYNPTNLSQVAKYKYRNRNMQYLSEMLEQETLDLMDNFNFKVRDLSLRTSTDLLSVITCTTKTTSINEEIKNCVQLIQNIESKRAQLRLIILNYHNPPDSAPTKHP